MVMMVDSIELAIFQRIPIIPLESGRVLEFSI